MSKPVAWLAASPQRRERTCGMAWRHSMAAQRLHAYLHALVVVPLSGELAGVGVIPAGEEGEGTVTGDARSDRPGKRRPMVISALLLGSLATLQLLNSAPRSPVRRDVRVSNHQGFQMEAAVRYKHDCVVLALQPRRGAAQHLAWGQRAGLRARKQQVASILVGIANCAISASPVQLQSEKRHRQEAPAGCFTSSHSPKNKYFGGEIKNHCPPGALPGAGNQAAAPALQPARARTDQDILVLAPRHPPPPAGQALGSLLANIPSHLLAQITSHL